MEEAQWIPRRLYIWVVKRGNAAPKQDRRTELAARTEAAKMV